MSRSLYHKEYYRKNREAILANVKKRYEEKTDEIKNYAKNYYLENRDKHRQNNINWIKNNPDKSKRIHADVMQRRRARLKGVKSDNYNRLDIYKKYGGFCIICNENIDLAIKHPNKQCFTIHHLMPISVGGDNTESNVAPAHFICNVMAGNKVPIAIKPRVYYV